MDTVKLKAALKFIDKWFERQFEKSADTVGASISVSLKGEVLYSKAFGFANLNKQEVLTPQDVFRVASHSKTFTAVAIMQLVEKGALTLHDPVSKYFPFLKENKDKRMHGITIAQMLSHSAGVIRDGGNTAFWDLDGEFPTWDKLKATLVNYPLVLENNTRFKYSNYTYALLGYLIEKISGISYEEYMQKYIIQPLSLTSVSSKGLVRGFSLVKGYTSNVVAGRFVPINSHVNVRSMVAATGFYANAEDLSRFYGALALKSGKLLSDESKKEMLRFYWNENINGGSSGYGLGVREDYMDGFCLNGHSGGMPGNVTQTRFDKETGLSISILTNTHTGFAFNMQSGVWHILNKFRNEYDENSPYKNCECEVFNIWNSSYYLPMGHFIYILNLEFLKPFDFCDTLKHLEGNKFEICVNSGYGSEGEIVEFVMNKNVLQQVKFNEGKLMFKAEYLQHLERIERLDKE